MKLSAEAKVGTTVLLSLVLLASMAMALGRVELGRPSGYEIQVAYSRVDGLREGAPVRFAGVNVGKVSFIQLEPTGVLVGVRIERDLPIPVDSRFVIANAGVLGDKHVEIYPGQTSQHIEENSRVSGVDPVVLDNILVEIETTLRGLNQVVHGFSEIADSQELKDSLVQSGITMQETILSLKQTVDQVHDLTLAANSITDQVEGFTRQLSDAEVREVVQNIQTFSRTLAQLNLVESLEELDVFARKLNEVPLEQISQDLQAFSRGLAAFDLTGMEQETRQFTRMLAAFDLSPLMDEVREITKELAYLDIPARGEEIAEFTGQLARFPLDELAADLQLISNTVKDLPISEIGDNLYALSSDVANMPLAEIMEDLHLLTSQIEGMGLDEMSQEVRSFTRQLASLELDRTVQEITGDIQGLTNQFAHLDLVTLFDELSLTVEGLRALSGSVEPESIERIVADLEASAGNVRLASTHFNQSLDQISGNTSQIMEETALTLVKVQGVVHGIQALVDDVQLFVDDIIDEGETAQAVRKTLSNIQKSTDELDATLSLVKEEVPLTKETFDDLRNTMTSIQKINEDIQTLKGMGEKVDIRSHWGLSYMFDSDGGPRPSADIRFEFEPEDYNAFYLVGWSDLGPSNLFQLQYGKDGGSVRQRYGIIDSSLGVGIDGQLSEKWLLSADLRGLDAPKLRLRADYQWIPDWWFTIRADDVFRDDEGGVSFGIERTF